MGGAAPSGWRHDCSPALHPLRSDHRLRLVPALHDAASRAACTELTPEVWATEPWYNRYVDNVCRLMSAVL